MYRKLISALLLAASSGALIGQTYENNGLLLVPPAIAPNIDAVNFVNRGRFVINFTNNTLPNFPPPLGLLPYETQNTRNYTNQFGAFLSCNAGFRFEHYDSAIGQRRRAANFFNDGTLHVGTVDTTNYLVQRITYFGTTNLFLATLAGSRLIVDATNIVNPGTVNLGFESLLSLKGNSVDLTRATIAMEPEGIGIGSGASPGFFFNQGIFDGYWGVGDVVSQRPLFYPFGITPVIYFGFQPVTTPTYPVTTRQQNLVLQTLTLPSSVSYLSEEINFGGSNRVVRAVFISNTNADVQANVYFPFVPGIAVEFTNRLGGATNNLYVLDYFGVETNLDLVITGNSVGNTTFTPFNYTVFQETPAFISPFLGPAAAPTVIPPGTFTQTAVTNQWSAYQAILQPLSVVLSDTTGQDVTNLPGRMEIVGDQFLDLTRANISSLNYLSVKGTNHFGGSSQARISAPYVDINVRSTNGVLTITNLLAPVLKRPEGDLQLFSARWTNITMFADIPVTNNYHVLLVDARFNPESASRIQDLVLRSTNTVGGLDSIVIHDTMNITRSLTLEASRITVATNEPGASPAAGHINLVNSSILWPNSTPRLQYLTNEGTITVGNTAFFGGSRTSPYYFTNFNEPYEAFVNRGTVSAFSSLIWAKTFVNSGLILAREGAIELQQAETTLLTNGTFVAGAGDIFVASGSLYASNHLMQAGGALTLAISNYLDDGSLGLGVDAITNNNTWNVGNGFNLLTLPGQSSLLGTTVFVTAAPGRNLFNQWAAQDRGTNVAGFSNNAAVGRLILDGGANSQFTFQAVGGDNAIYVDLLDLRNFATNINLSGNLTAVQVNPGMKIYYGQALAGDLSVAERINNSSGGRLVWVSDYAGFYSGTNVVYPDGSTNRLNAALVESQNEDSDCDGLPNAADPSPVFLVTTATLPEATNGWAYSAALQSGGGVAPFTWSLAAGSAPLPDGLGLSAGGVISGTPTQVGLFDFRVRVTQGACGLAAERDLAINVGVDPPVLVMALEQNSPVGARVSWETLPNSTNYVFYRDSLASGDWQVLTNFTSVTGGTVSIWDPVGTNQARHYRVQVQAP